jgi:hypothetical protein
VPEDELAQRFGPGKARLIKSGEIGIDDLAKRVKNKTWGDSIVEKPLRELGGSGPKARIPKPKPKPKPSKEIVTDGIDVIGPIEGDTKKAFTDAIAQIQKIHNPKIKLNFVGTKTSGGHLGTHWRKYRPTIGKHSDIAVKDALTMVGVKRTGVTNTGRKIFTKEDWANAKRDRVSELETAIHEIGHSIDYQVLSELNSFTKSFGMGTDRINLNANRMKNWRKAIVGTESRSRISAAYSGKHRTYLLSPVEEWARAYVQWIATKNGNKALLKKIAADPIEYWTAEEFGPIMAEMDKILLGV